MKRLVTLCAVLMSCRMFAADWTLTSSTVLTENAQSVYPGETRPRGQFTLSNKKMWFSPDFGISGFQLIVR